MGDGRRREEIHQARRRRLQGQHPLAHVRPQRRDLLRLQPADQRKGHQVRQPRSDEERQQHLEDLRQGRQGTQVTNHGDGNLFFPSISADGKTIVYEDNFGIWKLDTATGKSSEIVIDIKSDSKENDNELVTITNDAEGFHLSPSNRRAAVVGARRDLHHRHRPRRAAARHRDAWKEQNPRWSPNGKWIAFVSDRTGREEVYISDELGKTVKKLSDADCDKSGIVWAPDSKSLLWTGTDHKLRMVDVDSGKTDIVAQSDAGNIAAAQFRPTASGSPTRSQDKLLRPHVWVKELATGQEHMIGGDDFLTSSGARWTPDGKKLLLIGGSRSARHGRA